MRPCILVVDDDTSVTALLCDHLEQQGYRATCCNDAAQALIQIDGMKVGLVIVDLMMPIYGSGVDFYNRIRASARAPKDLPIIFLTGAAPEQARRVVPLHDPRVRLLFKPTTLAGLTRCIEELGGKRLLDPKPRPAPPGK